MVDRLTPPENVTSCYRLTVSYRGTAYAGWQRQKNALAVQEAVEDALEDLLRSPVRLFAAGRTDAGVHALGQVAHCTLAEPFPLTGLVHGTNQRLPEDIRILAAHRMPAGFDARRHALAKAYVYRVYRGRVVPAPLAPWCLGAGAELDLPRMRQALRCLPGRHDFSAFALAGGSHQTAVRRLFSATADARGRELVLRFIGDGFLRGMVRSLVGTLLEVAGGQRSAESFRTLLTDGRREAAGPTAAAHGLTLEQVFYPPRWRPLDGYET